RVPPARPLGPAACPEGPELERRSVAGREPQALEVLVEPGEREREPGHVEARHELADLRAHELEPCLLEQRDDAPPQHEELFILRAAEPVEDRRDARAGAFGRLGEDLLDEEGRELARRRARDLADPRLAVD